MHRLHNSFSQSRYLFTLELAPVKMENSLECSHHTCAHTWACMSPATQSWLLTEFAATLVLEVGSNAHWPRVPSQNTNPSSSAPSPTSTNKLSVPTAALPSPEPEMQILAEQATQTEDSAEAASPINKSFLIGWQWTAAAQQSLPVEIPAAWPRWSPFQRDREVTPCATDSQVAHLQLWNSLMQCLRSTQHKFFLWNGLTYDTAEDALLSIF